MLPDIVYPVRPGVANEALRYSLRSLRNVPHRRVFLAGAVPSWATNVVAIPTVQTNRKHANALQNLRAVLDHPDLGDEFLYFNDDFFVMRPVPEVPPMHRGPLAEVEALFAAAGFTRYLDGLRDAGNILGALDVDDPHCFELHIPFPARKDLYRETLELCSGSVLVHHRTVYGSLYHTAAGQMDDVKVYDRTARFRDNGVFLSTHADSFAYGAAGRFIRQRFQTPSKYEVS